MNERRRLLLTQQENNPWEKLDDLTLIVEENGLSFWIDTFTVSVYYKEYEDSEDEELIERVTSTILYSLDDGKTWNQENDRLYITLNKNETVKFRSNLAEIIDVYNYYINNDNYNVYRSNSGGCFVIYNNSERQYSLAGSPMSLLKLGEITYELPNFSNIFSGMFSGHKGLKQILNPKTFLPFKNLSPGCYQYMFDNCRDLINAPALPVTELTEYCYYQMFNGCRSLINAPKLPATELAGYCYCSMFDGCSSLVNAPELPATELAEFCYASMFDSCTSLTSAPSILPATTLAKYCYYRMFYDCSLLTTAPELPATTLVDSCYYYMFYSCESLNYVKALFTTTPSTSYTYYWLNDVSSTGTFVKNKNATWNVTGAHGVPSGWTVITE